MTQRTNYRDAAVSGFNNGESPLAVAWPDTESGDRVLLICSGEGNGTDTFTPDGSWTSLGKTGGGTGITFQVYELDGDASGSETGTFDVVVSPTPGNYSFICVSVANPTAATEAQFTSGTAGQADPASITPSGGSQHYTFIVGASIDAARAITSWPTDYGQWVSDARNTERGVFCLYEVVASSEDPGAFGHTSDGWATATIAIPTTAPTAENFPQVDEARATSLWTTEGTSQTMNLPSGSNGILIAEISADGNTTATITGWTELASVPNSTTNRVTILTREADGSEGVTATVTLSASEEGSAICSRIAEAALDDMEAQLVALGGTNAPDPPSLTPAAGSAEVLWLVGWGSDGGGSTGDIQTQKFPIRFGASIIQVRHPNTPGASIVSGFRAEETTSVDPPAGSMTNTRPTVAYTIAIYPSGSGPTPPPTPGGNRMGDTGAIRRRGGFPR